MIFLAVALFAALIYAFNQSSRTSTSVISDSQVDTYANQIVAQANDIKNAVKRVQLRGCDDTDLSFANNKEAGYTNASAPSNNTCHIFHDAGGGLTFKPIPDVITSSDEWLFTADNQVEDVGTNNAGTADLIIALANIPLEVCNQINDGLRNGWATPPVDDTTWDETKFTGTYSNNDDIGNGADLADIPTGCFQDGSSQYVFYTVLVSQ
ncbi:MAG: hypothetical protein AAGB32_02560 [Pseudomonadota bacterium]